MQKKISGRDKRLFALILWLFNEGVDDNLEIAWDTKLAQRLKDINRKTAIGEPSSQVFSELR